MEVLSPTLETYSVAQPAMDPELVRILESFDQLKLPPLSAEVAQYLEAGELTHARLESRHSFWGGGNEDGRANLLEKIQGQLKRGGPWLKSNGDRKKSKRELAAHGQILDRGSVAEDTSNDRSPSSSNDSTSPGGPYSNGLGSEDGTPTSVLLYSHHPDLDSDPLLLDGQQSVAPTTAHTPEDSSENATETVDCPSLPRNIPIDDLSLPTHLRCQTSVRPDQRSLPSSPFRSLTPSPLGQLSRTSRSFPSSPDPGTFGPFDQDAAQYEPFDGEQPECGSGQSPEFRPVPNRRRKSPSSGLRRALFSVAHTLKSSLSHGARSELSEHVAMPQPMDAAAVARHLLAPPRKLAVRTAPPIRRMGFSQPIQPAKWNPRSSFERSVHSSRGSPFAWEAHPLSREVAATAAVDLGRREAAHDVSMATLLEEQRLEISGKQQRVFDAAPEQNGRNDSDETEMETDEEGYFAPTSWKALSDPTAAGGSLINASEPAPIPPEESEDFWLECIDKKVVGVAFWNDAENETEACVDKRVTEDSHNGPVNIDAEPLVGAHFLDEVGHPRTNLGAVIDSLECHVSEEGPLNAKVRTGASQEQMFGSVDEVHTEAGEGTAADLCRDVRVDTCENASDGGKSALASDKVGGGFQGSEARMTRSTTPPVAPSPDFFLQNSGASLPISRRVPPAPLLDIPSPAGASVASSSPTDRMSPRFGPQTPEKDTLQISSADPASPSGSLSQTLQVLNLGGLLRSQSSAPLRGRDVPDMCAEDTWHVPSNPTDYEDQVLKEALPSIYKDGHYIQRSRIAARPHTSHADGIARAAGVSTERGDVGRLGDRGVPLGALQAQQPFKLQWKRESVARTEGIDEEQYQKALFGTLSP